MNTLDLSIIIVNYNTEDLIGLCLDSLDLGRATAREVFVVDNASTDGSVEIVRRYPKVHLIVNSRNRGFAAANNQALPRCCGRYLYYLNPDTVLTSPDVFDRGLRFLDAHPQVGLAGTRLLHPDGSPQESVSWRYPGQKYAGSGSGMDHLPGSIACVMGSSMFARADLIRQLGGYDEAFFLYGEDQDLCLRIRRAGYEIGYIEKAPVIHHGGQSERQSPPAAVWAKKTRAEYLFYRKHYPPETVSRIRRADLLKARFRLATLALALPFRRGRRRAEGRGKQIKYRAICDTLQSLDQEERP